jgi:hypothetical protein
VCCTIMWTLSLLTDTVEMLVLARMHIQTPRAVNSASRLHSGQQKPTSVANRQRKNDRHDKILWFYKFCNNQHGQHFRVKQMQCINKIGTSSAFLTFCTTLYCHRRGKVIKWVQKVACDKAQWFILVTQNHACIFSFLLLKSSIWFCFCWTNIIS